LSDDHLVAERLLAERAERRRIAEQLHDGPVQHVAALSQMLDAAVAALEEGDVETGQRVAQVLAGRMQVGLRRRDRFVTQKLLREHEIAGREPEVVRCRVP